MILHIVKFSYLNFMLVSYKERFELITLFVPSSKHVSIHNIGDENIIM